MNKVEFNKTIKEKFNQISTIKNDIKELKIQFAKANTKFKEGDTVTSSTFNKNLNIVLECVGDFDYSIDTESIVVDCEVVQTDHVGYRVGQIFSIDETFLTKI